MINGWMVCDVCCSENMPDAEEKSNPKNVGYDFYTNVLGAPKLVLAPMVDQRFVFVSVSVFIFGTIQIF